MTTQAEAQSIASKGYLSTDQRAVTTFGYYFGELELRKQWYRTASTTLLANTTFEILLYEIMNTIDTTGYFRAVMSFIRDARSISTPGVCVWPKSDVEVVAGISSTGIWTDYAFDVGIVVKAKNDINVMEMILKAREVIRSAFPATKIYSNVVRHIQTFVDIVDITGPEQGPEGTLLFGSGLIIRCRVQESGASSLSASQKQYYRTSVTSLPANAKFATLFFLVMNTINVTTYFRAVMAFIREARTITTPAVCVWPKSDKPVEEGISNVGTWVDYAFDIGIAIKAKDDLNVTEMVLKARDVIRAEFPPSKTYSDVSGHFQTIIEITDITGPEKGPNQLLLFGSGLVITCRVQE